MSMWQKINNLISGTAKFLQSLAHLVVSATLLLGACGLVWVAYKGILYALANKPWWLKFLGV